MEKSKAYLFFSGEAIKAETGVKEKGNRHSRRHRIRQPLGETLRKAKRVDRIMMLKGDAQQIKDWYPETFKENDYWKWIENQMLKLLGRQGETNKMEKRAKRK
jgi:hypothetical protein